MGVTSIFFSVPASFSLLSLSGSWCLRFWDKKFILLLRVKLPVLVREKVFAHTPVTNAWSVFLWTSTIFLGKCNRSSVPSDNHLVIFYVSIHAVVSFLLEYKVKWVINSCKIMFFWWCEKQTNHAGMSPPLPYIFHFSFCFVDLHVTVSLAFFFFLLPFFFIWTSCPLYRLSFSWKSHGIVAGLLFRKGTNLILKSSK